MATNTSFDAFALWKNLYDQTENAWRDVIQQTLEQKSFAEGLGQVQSQYLQVQGIVNGLTEAYLKQLNMPSRDEIAQVASLIINVDAKVDELEDQLDDLSNTTNTKAVDDVKRDVDTLKRSVTKLDKKLDTVISLLNTTIEKQNEAIVKVEAVKVDAQKEPTKQEPQKVEPKKGPNQPPNNNSNNK